MKCELNHVKFKLPFRKTKYQLCQVALVLPRPFSISSKSKASFNQKLFVILAPSNTTVNSTWHKFLRNFSFSAWYTGWAIDFATFASVILWLANQYAVTGIRNIAKNMIHSVAHFLGKCYSPCTTIISS